MNQHPTSKSGIPKTNVGRPCLRQAGLLSRKTGDLESRPTLIQGNPNKIDAGLIFPWDL